MVAEQKMDLSSGLLSLLLEAKQVPQYISYPVAPVENISNNNEAALAEFPRKVLINDIVSLHNIDVEIVAPVYIAQDHYTVYATVMLVKLWFECKSLSQVAEVKVKIEFFAERMEVLRIKTLLLYTSFFDPFCPQVFS